MRSISPRRVLHVVVFPMFDFRLLIFFLTLRVLPIRGAIDVCEELLRSQVSKAGGGWCLEECCNNELCSGVLLRGPLATPECTQIFCSEEQCWSMSDTNTLHHFALHRRSKRTPTESGMSNETLETVGDLFSSKGLCGGVLCGVNERCDKPGKGSSDECVCVEGYERKAESGCVLKTNHSKVSASQKLALISFTIDGPTTVQLPMKDTSFRIVLNASEVKWNYTYYWEVLEGAGFGAAKTYTEPSIVLSSLKEGTIRLRAKVSNETASGFQDVSLNVLAEKRTNRAPVALIRPPSPVTASEGSSLVLDGEGSSDEDGDRLEFEWKLLNGPAILLPAMNTGIVRLDNLYTGNYTFGLTVKDKEGARDYKTVDVIVSAKRDDPPKAKVTECGDSTSRTTIDVRLPRKTLLLCGNASSDDFGITSYKWFRIDNLTAQLAVDYSGSTAPVLTLTNLQANEKLGPYIFRLDVTDTGGHTDSATISILVNKAANQRPVPDAGGNQTVQLPANSAVLTGNVKDDGEIVSYLWTQISGPNLVEFINQDKSKCTVSGFVEGLYSFRLNVTDDGGLSATDQIYVNVVRSKNEPPVARARNVTVLLPANYAVLNASESSDDAGIVRYLWTPHDGVPACIMFLGSSKNEPIALLVGLVPGEFLFDITVSDHSNEEDTATVLLRVIAGEEQMNSVEMYMEQDYADITYRLRNKLDQRLSASLAAQIAEADSVDVHFSDFAQDPTSGRLRVVFHCEYQNTSNVPKLSMRDTDAVSPPSGIVIDAARAVAFLRNEANMIAEFHVDSIDTLYCFRDCSGHGKCNKFSKQCECDHYWMPNLINFAVSGGRKRDCSWSVLYFGMFVLLIAVSAVFCIPILCSFRGSYKIPKWEEAKNRVLRRRRRRRLRRSDEVPSGQLPNGNVKYNSDQSLTYSLLNSDSLTSESEAERAEPTEVRTSGANADNVELRERSNWSAIDK